MRHYLVIIGLVFCCIVGLLCGLLKYWDFLITDFGIIEDKVIVVQDDHKVHELIAKNTPVRVEIMDQRWGTTVIEDPAILFDIWNLLRDSKIYPDKYLLNQNRINGLIYFYDGSKQSFCIPDGFQLGDALTKKSEEAELDVKKLYRTLRYTMATKNNLMEIVGTADAVYLYKAENFFDLESDKMLRLCGNFKQKLLASIAKSHRITDNNKLNHFLLGNKSRPLFHIALLFKEMESERLIIISVLSSDYFNVMDMSYLDRNIIYFEGPLGDFCDKMAAFNDF